MRLEQRILTIKGVTFAERTEVSDGVLHINRHELEALLEQDKRLSKVNIELASPGESCRILQVCDVIEPRAKIGGGDFPGVLSKQGAGEGSTCVLRGAAVVINDYELSLTSVDQAGKTIDMSGPGAEASVYSRLHNVVVVPHAADGVSTDAYRLALKLAGLRAAVYLAEAGKEVKPDAVEAYDLPPLVDVAKGAEGLPRIAYVFQVYMNQLQAIPGEPIVYGDSIRRLLPVIIHPNEVLDGAVINAFRGGVSETYAIQNNPVIKELYRRHGKDICFVGVVLTVCHSDESDRDRTAFITAHMVKSVLGADGVVITKVSGGAPEVDMAQIADRCEELGVRTVLIMLQQLAVSDGGGALFNLPRVNAITVTSTAIGGPMSLPAMEKVIGRPVTLFSGVQASGEIKKMKRDIAGGEDQLGHSRVVSVRY
jgi:glycine reductase complex component B subunit alpha and beta